MKIYFVNPPSPDPKTGMVREGRCMQTTGNWLSLWPPYSLCLSAAVLERISISTKVADCIAQNLTNSQLEQQLRDYAPDAVVINTASPSIENDIYVARLAKKINPAILTLAIGIHPTALPDQCLRLEPALDIIIRGEIEKTLEELFRLLNQGKSWKNIQGISYRKGNSIIHNTDRPFLKNLDWLPYPAWEKVDPADYKLPFSNKPYLLLGTARGCPYHCSFCYSQSYYGSSLRYRSPKKVVDEVEYVKKRFRITEFLIWTESFTHNKKYCEQICDEIIRRKLGIRFVCNSRVDTVDFKLLQKLRQAGCWMIAYGLESGNQTLLDRIEKGITLSQSTEACRLTHQLGMIVVGHFILGLPGETPETIKRTIRFAKKQKIDIAQFYLLVPMPWKPLYQELKAKGHIVTDDLHRYTQSTAVIRTEKLTSKQLERWRRIAYISFFARPVHLLKLIRKLGGLRKLILSNLGDYLRWVFR